MIRFSTALILFLSLSFNLKAEAPTKVLYGDYVNCYYELAPKDVIASENPNASTKDKVKFNGFLPYKSWSREQLKEQQNESINKLLSETDYDLYLISYEGLFGVKMTAEHKAIANSYVGQKSLTVDFRVVAEGSTYNLCYERKFEKFDGDSWDGVYSTKFYEGACLENLGYFATNNFGVLKVLGPEGPKYDGIVYNAEKLPVKYYGSSFYPFLQDYYMNRFAKPYFLGGFEGYLCSDAVSKTVSNFEMLTADERGSRDFFNEIVLGEGCFSACKKLGIVEEIKSSDF